MTATKLFPGSRSRLPGSTTGLGRPALRLLALVSLPAAAAQGQWLSPKEAFDRMTQTEAQAKASKGVANSDRPFPPARALPPPSDFRPWPQGNGLLPPQPGPDAFGPLDMGSNEVFEDLMNALSDLPEAEKLMNGAPDKTKDAAEMSKKVRGLFPGPLLFEANGAAPRPPMPFVEPDPLVMDMLQDMDHTVQDVLMPAIHGLANSIAPMSCEADLKKHCLKARSQVHCLGQHSADISPACREDVGKSVPFICSDEISKFCDVLHMGLLKCLDGHFSQLNPECKDSVAATRQVVKQKNKGGMQDLIAAVVEAPEALEQRLDDQLSRLAAEAGLPTSLAQMPNMQPTISAPRVSLWMVAALLLVAFAGYALTASETVQKALSKAFNVRLPAKEGDRKPLLSMVEMPAAV